jgi:hypothetical protein
MSSGPKASSVKQRRGGAVGRLLFRMKSTRARAARCEEQARHAKDPTQQRSFLRAAAAWTKIADELADELERDTRTAEFDTDGERSDEHGNKTADTADR